METVFGHLGNPRKAFTNACRRAGVKNFRFHDLRHTAGTYMVAAGVPYDEVMRFMGLRSLAMVLRYAHALPSARQDAIMALSSRINSMLGKHDNEAD